MKRKNPRKNQERLLTMVEGIYLLTFLLSMSAMDSPDVTIPSIALILSGIGLFVTFRLEEGRKRC